MTHDKGVKVGDKIRILIGEAAGEIATVERVGIYGNSQDRDAIYGHTVFVVANITTEGPQRFLFWDWYEKI